MFKILIADDHPLFRSGVKAASSNSEDYLVEGEAEDFGHALSLLKEHQPDILILDVEMPGGRAFPGHDCPGKAD